MHPGAKWVRHPAGDGEWWNVVETNASLSAKLSTGYPSTGAQKYGRGLWWLENEGYQDKNTAKTKEQACGQYTH